MNRSLSILIFFFMLGSSSGHAQQVYQAYHYGTPGTLYLYNPVFGFGQDSMIIKSGADVTWDLSSYTNLDTHPVRIVTKESAFDFFTFVTICALGGNTILECSNVWNNTDQAWLVSDTISLFQFQLTNLQRFQNVTPNRLLENFLGFTVELSGTPTPAAVVYENPDTILHFPVLFGDHFTSSTAWTIDLAAVGQNVRYQSRQSRNTTIDAWGDLVTPDRTFENVVRMRSLVTREDSITTDSFSLPIHLKQVEYMWFDTSYKLPVMTANGFVTDSIEVLGNIQFLYDKTCAPHTWSVSLDSDTYTIDSTGSVTITFTVHDGNADVYTWDWGDGEVTTSTGTTTHTFTETGAYSVGAVGCMTNCLPLNSCDGYVLDFAVVSTTNVPGERVGLTLSPNPVSDVINVFVPQKVDATTFLIIDMNGKVAQEGTIKTGTNHLQVNDLAEGMYAIQIGKYFLRFIKQ